MKQERIKDNLTPGLTQQTLACKVTEHIVSFIWEKQLFNIPKIYCIYPGRKNNDSGPDFKDAVLINESGKTLIGDVEIHVKTGDWFSHGHHKDPAYNKVVLHISLWDDKRKEVFLQNGLIIPNISLFPFLKDSWDQVLHLYNNHSEEQRRCLIQPNFTTEIIQQAGEQRFRQKLKFFYKQLLQEDGSQVLYTGIMRALGYSKNKEPLQLISKHIPLIDLTKNIKTFQTESSLLILESLLLGSGGLLFSEYIPGINENHKEKMISIWGKTGYKSLLNKNDWNLCKVRPENYPGRRLIGAANLINRFTPDSFLQNILTLIKSITSINQIKLIENSFIVKENAVTYIGKGRAREIVINIILPFIGAWARVHDDRNMELHVLTIYNQYPKLTNNYITSLMAKQLSIKNSNSAKEQQGLQYIFDGFCREHRCGECRTNLAPILA